MRAVRSFLDTLDRYQSQAAKSIKFNFRTLKHGRLRSASWWNLSQFSEVSFFPKSSDKCLVIGLDFKAKDYHEAFT